MPTDDPVVKPPSSAHLKAIEAAASLTAAQLDQASDIVKSRFKVALEPNQRAKLEAAVLQAIALNYHAMLTLPKR